MTTDIEIIVCQEQGCPKRTITGSEFCGDHTSNAQWMVAVEKWLSDGETISNHALISEVESTLKMEDRFILDAEINDCQFASSTFNAVHFERNALIDVVVEQSTFEKCVFDGCEFNQIEFLECRFIDCEFRDCEFRDCQIVDGSVLDSTKFMFCRFSNTDFGSISSAAQSQFLDCIITIGSFNNSNLQGMHFAGVEFTKTALSFCDFRGSVIENIYHDFDQVGLAPVGCNFYGCTLEDDFIVVLEKYYNNVRHIDEIDFISEVIEALAYLRHPNLLSELNQFIERYELLRPVISLKGLINDHYRELAQIALDTDNPAMMGSMMSTYSQLPTEIRQSAIQLIASASYLPRKKGQATLEITFDPAHPVTFSKLNELNQLLENIFVNVAPENDLEVVSMRQGSFIQVLMGSWTEILVIGGTLYTFTKATLHLAKEGSGVRNSLADHKTRTLGHEKSKLEIRKLEHEVAELDKQKLLKNRKEEFIKCTESYEATDKSQIPIRLKNIEKDTQIQEYMDRIDREYGIKKIEVRVNN